VKKQIFFLTTLLLLAGATFFLASSKNQDIRSKAAVSMVDLTLSASPNRITLDSGNYDVSVSVLANANTYKVSAVELVMTYDANVFTPVSITGSTFLSTVLATGSAANGIAKITLGSGTSPKTGSGILAVLKLKHNNTSGSGVIKVDSTTKVAGMDSSDNVLSTSILGTAGSVTVTAVNVEPPVTSTSTPTPIIAKTTNLNLKLKFQGINKKPSAGSTMDVLVKVAANNIDEKITSVFTVGDDGVWSGTAGFNLATGSAYTVYIKGPKHIQKKICINKPTEDYAGTYHCDVGKISLIKGNNSLDFSGITLLAGDLPTQDGVVNSYDTSLVRNNLGKSDSANLTLGDLNLDGIIDSQDYSMIINSLSIRLDEE